MARALYIIVGIAAYLIFFVTFLYLIGFLFNHSPLPHTVDRGPVASLGAAIVADLGLIALFGVQHSIMARPGFKAAWTRIVPAPIERSVYVLFASAALIILYAFWQPIGGEVWRVTDPIGVAALWVLFATGWAIVLLSTLLISHFELFGLQQVWLNWRGALAAAPQFRQPLLYKLVRHPLYSGFVLAFWATPVMSYGHLLFALGMSAYILVAIPHEERDLVALFGSDYEAYRQRVGMLTPRLRSRG